MTVNWTNGNGNGRLLIAKANSPVDVEPQQLVEYPNFTGGFGTSVYEIGSGNYVLYDASGSSANLTNLQPGITYHFALFEFNGSNGKVYLSSTSTPSVSPATASQITSTTPTLNTTNMNFSVTDGNRLRLDFSSFYGNGDKRLIIAKAGSEVTATPVNGLEYSANSIFGNGTEIAADEFVIYSGIGGHNTTVTNLNPDTDYHLKVFEFNGDSASTFYLTSSDNIGNPVFETVKATSGAPTIQASNLTFNNIEGTQMTVNWTNGDGNGRLLIAKANSPVDVEPQQLINYPNSTGGFGNSSVEIGSGNYVLYDATGSSANITNLEPGVTYHFALFEYNGFTGKVYLNTTSTPPAAPATASQITATSPTLNTTDMNFTAIDGNRLRINFVTFYGNGDKRLIIAKAGSQVTATPIDGQEYSANSLFGDGTEIAADEFVIYSGTAGHNTTLTNLNPDTTYFIKVFEYNGSGVNTFYLTSNDISSNPVFEISQSTISAPTINSGNAFFNTKTSTSFNLNWTNGDGNTRILIARENEPVNVEPVDLVSYSASSNNFGNSAFEIGSGNYAVYDGFGNSVNVTNLSPGTNYHFALFEYNGSTGKVYLRPGYTFEEQTFGSTPLTQVSNASFSNIGPTSMLVEFDEGDASHRLVLAKESAAVDANPIDLSDYLADNNFGNGEEIGVGNYVVFNGTDNQFQLTGLDSNTTYELAFFEYAISANGNLYLTPSYTASQSTLALLGDNVCDAVFLSVNASSAGDAYSNVGATSQADEPDNNLNNGVNNSVWFRFTAPEYGNVQITTDIIGGTLPNTEIAVYEVGDCIDFTTYTQIGFDQDSGLSVLNSSTINLYDLIQGQTYYVQVDGFSASDQGTFGIEARNLTYTFNPADGGFIPSNPNGQTLTENVLIVETGTAVLDQPTALRNVIVNPIGVLDLDADLTSDIIFKSDASGSGQFDNATGVNSIGNAIVERYVPAGTNDRRAYRLLTSSVNSMGTVNANWQEGVNNTGINFPTDNQNPNPGYGIHISGSQIGANGFDATGSGNPSMFTFDNSFVATGAQTQSDAWSALPNTDLISLKAGEPYLTFIRGDRSINVTSNSATPTNTTLRATGDLYIGTRVFSSANNVTTPEYGMSNQADYFSLVGNPYQAIVDFTKLDLTNVNPNFYWVWDANMSTRGAYVAIDLSNGNSVDPIDTSTDSTSPANQFIQPGQSFFVQTINSATASLDFNEDDKDVTGGFTIIFSEPNSHTSLNMLLYSEQAYNSGKREADALRINFDENYNNAVDIQDADKVTNPDENFARLENDELISIENRAIPIDGETLALSTIGYAENNYTFVVNASNIQNHFDAYLADNYTGTQTQLIEGTTQVNYTVDANIPESVASDRFSLIFDNTTLGIEGNTFGADISLYPNPTNDGDFSIYTPNLSGEVSVEISNLLGQQVYNQKLSIRNQNAQVITKNLLEGVFLVKLKQNQQSHSMKLIVD